MAFARIGPSEIRAQGDVSAISGRRVNGGRTSPVPLDHGGEAMGGSSIDDPRDRVRALEAAGG